MKSISIKLDRSDKDAYRLVQDGIVVGLALRLSNDRWGAYDGDETRLTKQTFSTPKEVRDWWFSEAGIAAIAALKANSSI